MKNTITRITPSTPGLNDEQVRLLALAAQLPPAPRLLESYAPGSEHDEQARALFERGLGQSSGELKLRRWQEALDGAISPEEARAYYEALDWSKLEIRAGEGISANVDDVSSPVRRLLLSGEGFYWEGGAYLTVYPKPTGENRRALLSILEARGLIEPMLEHMPSRLALSKDEAEGELIRVGDDLWYEHAVRKQFARVLSVSPARKQYIDADNRPWDNSHDGNGWTIWVRDYELGDVISSEDPRYSDILTARDTKAALMDVDQEFLSGLSRQEYASYVAARLAAYRDKSLSVYKGEDGLWHTIPASEVEYAHALRGHLKREEAGWRHLGTGVVYHKDADTFVEGAGPDVNQDWETL